MKTKILYQLNQLGYGGTEKAIYTFIKNIDKERFDISLFFYTDYKSLSYYRVKFLSFFSKKYKAKYTQKYIINFARKEDFERLLGKEKLSLGNKQNFLDLCLKNKPDIIHFNRGIENDFYTDLTDTIPADIKLVETNIFGKPSNEKYLARLSSLFFVSKWLMQKSQWRDRQKSKVLYNPIVLPSTDEDLRKQLSIPSGAIVLGRISRPNLDEGEFILNVLHEVLDDSIYFISIGASENFIQNTKDKKNIINLDPTTDEAMLSRFYNTLDILLHYRIEGETFGMNIAEAMIHSKPVVSHYSYMDNAQAELLLEEKVSGIVVEENNINEYINAVKTLINDADLRAQYSKDAKIKSDTFYSEIVTTKTLEDYYNELI